MKKSRGDQHEEVRLEGNVLSGSEAQSMRALMEGASAPQAGVPISMLAAFAAEIARPLVIDFSAARQIGVPVIVLREQAETSTLWRRLTKREREVVRLIAAGKRNLEIADTLKITLATVKDHVHHALRKTGLSTRAALAAICPFYSQHMA